jgi:hypothetical protein
MDTEEEIYINLNKLRSKYKIPDIYELMTMDDDALKSLYEGFKEQEERETIYNDLQKLRFENTEIPAVDILKAMDFATLKAEQKRYNREQMVRKINLMRSVKNDNDLSDEELKKLHDIYVESLDKQDKINLTKLRLKNISSNLGKVHIEPLFRGTNLRFDPKKIDSKMIDAVRQRIDAITNTNSFDQIIYNYSDNMTLEQMVPFICMLGIF